ncbi:hypothetical protein BDY21DRAFT_129827 [Lineolata rhizophorae]|uniref:Uncharacterized protein n=1 Tax=Lineolata rhizophorae TaxID=578093 RepID=A0A6A6NNT2_9PEZI|nr:hypothetical protein BDY21DRAFT_129827 [Lineolata rhizophorae]
MGGRSPLNETVTTAGSCFLGGLVACSALHGLRFGPRSRSLSRSGARRPIVSSDCNRPRDGVRKDPRWTSHGSALGSWNKRSAKLSRRRAMGGSCATAFVGCAFDLAWVSIATAAGCCGQDAWDVEVQHSYRASK